MEIINKLKSFVFYAVLFLMSVVACTIKSPADPDLWHRLAVGKIFSQIGNIIYHDIFSYLPTKPIWVDHEWLSAVVFYNLSLYFGDYGLTALKILIMFGILVLVHRINLLIHPEEGKKRLFWYFITLLAILIGLFTTIRCQAFTYLFFTLWIYILERVRRGENKLIWIFPATTLLWANMHAGFFAGFGLVMFYAAGEFLNRKNPVKYFGILALCLPVTLINPYGPKYWHYLIEAVTMPRPFIKEWEALNPFADTFRVFGTKIQVILILTAILYIIIKKIKDSRQFRFDFTLDWAEIIAITATFFLCLKHYRHVTFFSITLAVYGYKYYSVLINDLFSNKIAEKLKTIILKTSDDMLNFAYFAMVYGFITGICLIMIMGHNTPVDIGTYPYKAVEFVRINRLEGNLLIPFKWGSYAMWKLYPQNLVSIDGRYEETYLNQSYMDAMEMTFHDDAKDIGKWLKTFNKYRHDIIIAERDSEFEKSVLRLKKWKRVYKDNNSVVIVPVSIDYKKWLLPTDNKDYYAKTKYENSINF